MSKLGSFVWRELMTNDLETATRYYGEVLGWKFKPVEMGGMTYTLIVAGEKDVGGVMTLPAGAPVPSHWYGYVSLADVDAAVKAATEAGGRVLVAAQDIPDVGRFAIVADPQGAVFAPFKHAGAESPPGMPKVGEFCWEQLSTTDLAGAKAFYAAVTGWTTKPFAASSGMDVFHAESGQVASLMQSPPGTPAAWLTYVVVDRLADANARATRNGGTVLMERVEVPTIGAFSVTRDPTGAVLCLFESAMA